MVDQRGVRARSTNTHAATSRALRVSAPMVQNGAEEQDGESGFPAAGQPSPPLHFMPIELDEWWACQLPERPYDEQTWYDERCGACQIKAGADLHHVGNRILFDPTEDRYASLSEIAAGSHG